MGEDLLPIGAFARMSGLTVKALRHYDEIGLLSPAYVDGQTGYRYYTLAQAGRAEAIRRLRALELPLDDVRAAVDGSPDDLRRCLETHRGRLETRAVVVRSILAELRSLIEGREPLVPSKDKIRSALELQEVPEERVLVVRDRVHQEEMSSVVPRQIEEVRAFLRRTRAEPAGPPVCICPFADEDGMLEAQTGWFAPDGVSGQGRIELKTLPATRALVLKHVGPYEQLSSSYRIMSEALAETGLNPAGAPRELYVTDPADVPDPHDYETLIVWPVEAEDGLEQTRERLANRLAGDA